MSIHSSTAARATSSETDETVEDSRDYEITGTFKDALYEKYDELLVRVNEILKRSKVQVKAK